MTPRPPGGGLERRRRKTFESYLEAEQKAAHLTRRYVVVECRADGDPPGVEAVFAVCPEDQVHTVANAREIVFTAEISHPTEQRFRTALGTVLWTAREAMANAGDDELLAKLLEGIEATAVAALSGRPA